MSAIEHSTGEPDRSGGELSASLTSLVDCLAVLVIYLLAAASLGSMRGLETGIATVSGDTVGRDNAAVSDARIVLMLEAAKGMRFAYARPGAAGPETFAVPAGADADWDWGGAVQTLQSLTGREPAASRIVVLAEDPVPYEALVRAAETMRRFLPVSLVAGEVR